MKTFNLLFMSFVLLLLVLVSCHTEEELTAPGKLPASSQHDAVSDSPTRLYASWIYVMDVRFSRETCATGPGVCFKNDFGDIWNYNFVDNSTDGDVGPVGVKLEKEQLHFTFFRSLEEDSFIIEEDVTLNNKLSRALGRRITLKAGNYPVSYDNYRYGEAYVDIVSGR
jgi:hypothetical protein